MLAVSTYGNFRKNFSYAIVKKKNFDLLIIAYVYWTITMKATKLHSFTSSNKNVQMAAHLLYGSLVKIPVRSNPPTTLWASPTDRAAFLIMKTKNKFYTLQLHDKGQCPVRLVHIF